MSDITFDAKKTADAVVKWVKDYFEKTASPETKAVIGISGGKDSSVAAAVCVKALGKDRVIGVLMPQGEQSDINYSQLLVTVHGLCRTECVKCWRDSQHIYG